MSYITQSNEIENVYSKITTLNYRSIAVTSSTSGEGTTSMVLALANRMLLAGHSVLVVDFNTYTPFFHDILSLPKANTASIKPALVSDNRERSILNGVCLPNSKSLLLKLRRTGEIEKYIQDWLNEYDYVIFDTTPYDRVNQHNISSSRVASACDAVLLLVLSGSTTHTMVKETVNNLQEAGANMLGCVMNDKLNPTLQNELEREALRLPKILNPLKTKITTWIKSKSFFKMEV